MEAEKNSAISLTGSHMIEIGDKDEEKKKEVKKEQEAWCQVMSLRHLFQFTFRNNNYRFHRFLRCQAKGTYEKCLVCPSSS